GAPAVDRFPPELDGGAPPRVDPLVREVPGAAQERRVGDGADRLLRAARAIGREKRDRLRDQAVPDQVRTTVADERPIAHRAEPVAHARPACGRVAGQGAGDAEDRKGIWWP